jgi:hypothetical protein
LLLLILILLILLSLILILLLLLLLQKITYMEIIQLTHCPNVMVASSKTHAGCNLLYRHSNTIKIKYTTYQCSHFETYLKNKLSPK